MKKYCTLALMLLFIFDTFAQDVGFISYSETRIGYASLTQNKQFTTLDYTVSNGYAFSRHFCMSIPLDIGVAMFDDNSTYQRQLALGLNAKYGFNTPIGRLETSVSCGSTLTRKAPWQYTYYDASIKNILNDNRYYAVGVRHYRPYNSIEVYSKIRTAIYVAFGFCIK